jgi:predicted RNA-binding protein YlxR (DUF448 family)
MKNTTVLPPPFKQKQPKKTLRMCIACRERKEKTVLIRIVKNEQGTWILDTSGKEQRRGAYICQQEGCKAKAKKNHKYSTIVL